MKFNNFWDWKLIKEKKKTKNRYRFIYSIFSLNQRKHAMLVSLYLSIRRLLRKSSRSLLCPQLHSKVIDIKITLNNRNYWAIKSNSLLSTLESEKGPPIKSNKLQFEIHNRFSKNTYHDCLKSWNKNGPKYRELNDQMDASESN